MELKEPNKPPSHPKYMWMALKTGSFLTYWLKNRWKCCLWSKLLYKIYLQDVFEAKINFNICCYLQRCGVIPVHIFGSHIHPQPPGLGLKGLCLTRFSICFWFQKLNSTSLIGTDALDFLMAQFILYFYTTNILLFYLFFEASLIPKIVVPEIFKSLFSNCFHENTY